MNFLPYSNAIKVARLKSKPSSDILSWLLIGFAIGTTLGTYSVLYIKHKNDLQNAADERSNQNMSLSRPKPIQTPIGAGVFSGWSRDSLNPSIQNNPVPATQKKLVFPSHVTYYGKSHQGLPTACKRRCGYSYDDVKALGQINKQPVYLAAVPRRFWSALHGKILKVSNGSRSILVCVHDKTNLRIKSNLDINRAAWNALFPGKQPGRQRVRIHLVGSLITKR